MGETRTRLADRGVALQLATVRGPVRDLLHRAGLWHPMRTAGQIHPDIDAAVLSAAPEPSSASRRDGLSRTSSRDSRHTDH